MIAVTYTSVDGTEVILIDDSDPAYNEQHAVRALFKSQHPETPASAGFGIDEGYEGDRDPVDYDRDVTDTGHDRFLTIDIRPAINLR